MENFNFLFQYQTRQDWELSGSATVKIFDTELYLMAGYDISLLGQIFTLTSTVSPEKELISFINIDNALGSLWKGLKGVGETVGGWFGF
jgi:hypothetical protein